MRRRVDSRLAVMVVESCILADDYLDYLKSQPVAELNEASSGSRVNHGPLTDSP